MKPMNVAEVFGVYEEKEQRKKVRKANFYLLSATKKFLQILRIPSFRTSLLLKIS